jgi:hypothetical protein
VSASHPVRIQSGIRRTSRIPGSVSRDTSMGDICKY